MGSGFHIGDKVEGVDDTTRGIVVAISGDLVTVESKDGFRLQYKPSELLLISGLPGYSVSSVEAEKLRSAEEREATVKHTTPKRKERNAPRLEVDLHINQLVVSTRGMSKYDILNLQIETAKRQLEFAIEKRIQKVVFIHGVGEGILKEELGYLLRRYPNVKYYDAEYQKYGMGATEAYIYQNA